MLNCTRPSRIESPELNYFTICVSAYLTQSSIYYVYVLLFLELREQNKSIIGFIKALYLGTKTGNYFPLDFLSNWLTDEIYYFLKLDKCMSMVQLLNPLLLERLVLGRSLCCYCHCTGCQVVLVGDISTLLVLPTITSVLRG